MTWQEQVWEQQDTTGGSRPAAAGAAEGLAELGRGWRAAGRGKLSGSTASQGMSPVSHVAAAL